MTGRLLRMGDPPPHRHDLPGIPTDNVTRFVGVEIVEKRQRTGALARCSECGGLFVSREDPESWGRQVYWHPVPWWRWRLRREARLLEERL